MGLNELISIGRELEALRQFRSEVKSSLERLDEALHVSEPPPAPTRPSEEVLVRKTPGPRPTIFHSPETPCGRVTGDGRSADNFSTMLRSKAEANGLEPCTACWSRWATG